MEKKHKKPMHIDFKTLFTIAAVALVAALITSLVNGINGKPFNFLLFIPTVVVLVLSFMRKVVGFGPFHDYHPSHHGKTNVKMVEPPTPEYRGGETFEADLDDPLLA